MKKLFLPVMLCAALLSGQQAKADANIYASGLKVDGNNVQFVLNAPGTVVVNFYEEGSTTPAFSQTATYAEKGTKTLAIQVPDDVAIDLVGKTLSWEVVATGEANENWKCFSAIIDGEENVPEEQKMGYTNGVAVDYNPESDYFGRIYMLNGTTSNNDGRQLEVGIYAYNPDLTIINEGTTAFNGNVEWNGTINANGICASPNTLAIDDEGNLYISDWSDNHSGVWMVKPENLGGTWEPLFEIGGSDSEGGKVYNSAGDYVHGSITGICLVGTGADRVLYTVDEDYEGGSILKYNIGDLSSLPISITPTLVYKLSDNENLVGARNGYLTPDRKGGFWFAQRSSTTTSNRGYFNLLHFTKDGTMDWSVEDYYSTSTVAKALRQMAFASNLDGSTLVFGLYQCIGVKDVVFNEDGTINSCTDGNHLKSSSDQRKISSTVMGAAFDVANNVFVADYSDYFQGYAYLNSDNTYTTKASKGVLISLEMTGVEGVAVDANAPVEYYNLQGVKVANPENGIFVKKQGSRITKVVR